MAWSNLTENYELEKCLKYGPGTSSEMWQSQSRVDVYGLGMKTVTFTKEKEEKQFYKQK